MYLIDPLMLSDFTFIFFLNEVCVPSRTYIVKIWLNEHVSEHPKTFPWKKIAFTTEQLTFHLIINSELFLALYLITK